ncbi:MAG: hypothetical protein A2516_02895 [Alphaproteobacteria bacterium RIFOXYD12_FULL_60_8]|nr:MAG: hypothetical protein A2516_02895 [Alphaproteobacteria bacterium RIFOXYD12_FULL_60_8]
MAPLTARLASARSVAQADFRIRVSDLESRLGLRYTVDTLRALKVRHPGAVFVWLMGADNLGQIHRWKRWTEIFKIAPIAVFDRSSYSYTALASPAAVRFSRSRVSARHLVAATPPAWAFLFRERHGASATEERARGHWKT